MLKKINFIFYVLAMSLLIACHPFSAHDDDNNLCDGRFSIHVSQISERTVKICLPEKRPKSFGMVSPLGEWFVIHSVDDGIELMPHKDFLDASLLNLNLERSDGLIWIEGKKVTRKLFVGSGEYTFIFADNLETEQENTFSFSGKVFIE